MTAPKKLTVPQLQAQIVKRQGPLLRQIAARHRKIAALQSEIAELHGQLHELPGTMVDIRDLGPRAAYATRAAVAQPSDDEVSTAAIRHIDHVRYNHAGVENLCKCTDCLSERKTS